MSTMKLELKADCTLVKDGEEIEAQLHLIEVRYSDRITFWNGVANLTGDNVRKFGTAAAGRTVVEVRLPDGRVGILHVTHFHQEPGYSELAAVGKPKPKSLGGEE